MPLSISFDVILKYDGDGTHAFVKHERMRVLLLALSADSNEWHGIPSFSAVYDTEAEKSVPAVNTASRPPLRDSRSAVERMPSLSFRSTGSKRSARGTHTADGSASTTTVVYPFLFAACIAGF